jgi:hypothetical protein
MVKKHNVLYRPNETIGFVPRYPGLRLEANDRKLYAAMLLVSQAQGLKKRYEYPLAELLKLCGLSFSQPTRVKEQLMKINSFKMDYNNREGVPKWKPLGLTTTIGLVGELGNQKGKAVVAYWELEEAIQERLMNPNGGFFTKMSLQIATNLSSGSSIALYEIACSYKTNFGGLSARYGIQEFIKMILGEQLTEEREWRFFKRDILKSAINEVNKLTDVTVEFKEFKTRQKITGVQLIVSEKAVIEEPLSQVEHLLTEQIQRLGIDLFEAQKLVKNKKHSTEKLARQIEIISKATPKNPLAYLKAGLRENYQKQITPAPLTQLVVQIPGASDPREKERRTKAFEDYLNKSDEDQRQKVDEWLRATNSMMRGFHKSNQTVLIIAQQKKTSFRIC